jgi:hypothetical protein
LGKILLVAVVTIAMTSLGAEAKTWYVFPNGSGSTPTIQSAVDSAVSGDNILIAPGVYHQGGIVVDGKILTIDQQGSQANIIAPSPGTGTCITVRNVPSFTLNSLAFRGFETAIAIENASPLVQYVTTKTCTRGVTVSGISSAPIVWFSVIDSCGTGLEIQDGASVLLRNETIANCTTGARFLGGTTTFTRNIVYHAETGVQCTGGSPAISCNDFYLNTADYGGCAAGTNDFYVNPLFCFSKPPAPGLYWLHVDSPCLTGLNPCGLKVGAFTASAGCSGEATERSTWGAIKSIYR